MSDSLLHRAVATVLPAVPRPLVWRVSRRYIAGTSLEDAFRVIAELNTKRIIATIDVLGEDSMGPDQVAASRDLYLEALESIAARKLDSNVSIKLSEMGLRFDTDLCRRTMEELVTAAAANDNFVRIDMEDSSVTEVTLAIYRELRRNHANVGTVIQSCLRGSEDDVKALLADGPTHLRLCKGIYREPEDIAFQDPDEIRASFRRILELLLCGGAVKVGIATHDLELIDHALTFLETHDIPRERYEFQMLLGVAERTRTALVANGHPLRVYVPFGESWFPYSVRRLRENPQIAGHIIRNMLSRD